MKDFKEFFATKWVVNNKTTSYVLVAIILISGGLTYKNLPKETFPDVVIPTIYINTIYPGTSPEDIENLITKPIEKELKGINGVKKMESQSLQDVSVITIEFTTDMVVDEAKKKVEDAVDKAMNELPDDLDNDPMLQEMDVSEMPIMNINMAGDFGQRRLKRYAEILEDEIESLPEIRRVDKIGTLDREIKVSVDLYKMQAMGITFRDIGNAIANENINISGGDIKIDGVERTMRIAGQFTDPEQIEEVVVRGFRGNAVKVQDIADIEDGFEDRNSYARLDGKPVVTLNVVKRGGENLIAASDKIRDIIEEVQANKFPRGLNITITGDQSDMTRSQLNDLINSVIIGFICVVLVLMFFMGTTNASFVGLAIPLSALMAMLFMPSLDFSLNMVVLFSFLLALGITVDNAIVVIENTYRIFNENPDMDIKTAARMASGEVFLPVLAGTLTTIAPFFPLLFWPGIMGEFMYYLPVTLIITLFSSLFVAFVINPVFATTFMKRVDKDEHGRPKRKPFSRALRPLIILVPLTIIGYLIHRGVGNFFVFMLLFFLFDFFVLSKAIDAFRTKFLPAMVRSYKNGLSVVLSGYGPAITVVVAVLMLALSVFLMANFAPKVAFFPQSDPNFVYIYNKMPIGTAASVTDSITKKLESRVYATIDTSHPAIKSVISNVGVGAGNPQQPDRNVTPHKSKITVAFEEFKKREGYDTKKALAALQDTIKDIPGATISVEPDQSGPPTPKPILIEIQGDDLYQLEALARELKDEIDNSGIQGIENLQSSLKLNKPEIRVDIDQEKALREGISTGRIAQEIRTALYGNEVSKYRAKKDEYPIIVRLKEKQRSKVEDLLGLQISYMDMASGRFRQVPLRSVVDVGYTSSYSAIDRKNQRRLVTLSSNVLSGYNANEIIQQIRPIVNKFEVPENYSIKIGGEQEDQKETQDFLSIAFAISIGLIFMVLITQFNSVSKPLIIFFTVILSVMGVLFGYVFSQFEMSIVMTGVGVISLAGIVVNNGILLIEFADEMRKRGLRLREAILEASAIRMTPILLTAFSTMLGLVPMAFALNINFATLLSDLDPNFFIGGDTAVIWGPLAWTIIFGLLFSTLMTLFVVPSMYLLNERLKYKLFPKNKYKSMEEGQNGQGDKQDVQVPSEAEMN